MSSFQDSTNLDNNDSNEVEIQEDTFDILKNYSSNNINNKNDSNLSLKHESTDPLSTITPNSTNSIISFNSTNTDNSSESIYNNNNNNNSLELGPHQPKNQREIDKRSIYVSNIPFKISPWKLKELFCNGINSNNLKINGCGENSVHRVTIVCDRVTGLPKGFAYIEFSNDSHILNALNFNNYELDGRIISVVKKRTNIPGMENDLINDKKNIKNDFNNFKDNNYIKANKDKMDYNMINKKDNKYRNFNDRDDKNQFNRHQNYNYNYNYNKNNNINNINNNINTNTDNTTTNNNTNKNYKNYFSNGVNYINHRNSNYNFIKSGTIKSFNNRHNYSQTKNDLSSSSSSSFSSSSKSVSPLTDATSIKSSNDENKKRINYSKLVIDDNHYLTPSSRVGVYNNE
jgi:RNA recognition motif-containing protein